MIKINKKHKAYTMKIESGRYVLKSMDIRLKLRKVREYIKYNWRWLIGLIIITLLQLVYILWREKILIYIIIDICFMVLSFYVGYKAITMIKKIKETVK